MIVSTNRLLNEINKVLEKGLPTKATFNLSAKNSSASLLGTKSATIAITTTLDVTSYMSNLNQKQS